MVCSVWLVPCGSTHLLTSNKQHAFISDTLEGLHDPGWPGENRGDDGRLRALDGWPGGCLRQARPVVARSIGIALPQASPRTPGRSPDDTVSTGVATVRPEP